MSTMDTLICPSRRGNATAKTLDTDNRWGGATSDYAGVGGHDKNGGRKTTQGSTGMFATARSFTANTADKTIDYELELAFRDVIDGASNTFMIGERHVPQNRLGLKNKGQWDGPAYRGKACKNCWHERGWTVRVGGPAFPLVRNIRDTCGQGVNSTNSKTPCGISFGSSHTEIVVFAMGDGSVTSISVDTAPSVLGRLTQRADGEAVVGF
jgi:hypothetical protein